MVGSGAPHGQTTLARFSRFIPWVIGLLVGSGTAIAVLQLIAPNELWTTTYGRVLSAKLVLVATILGLAGYNRYWLTAEVLKDNRRSGASLTRAVAIELALIVAILGTVATHAT
jgi:copper transport protein